jgi:hypothetical protein
MFRVGHLYFMEISIDTIQDSEPTGRDGFALKKDLLRALETARSRLAIAIAVESKSTPADRRRYYLDTADYLRIHIARLREERCNEKSPLQNWASVLETLRKMSVKNRAHTLCTDLRRTIELLE